MKKLGTIDIFIVEANPIVFKGRPWLMQYIRYMGEKKHYRGNTLGTSYFRFLDMTDMKTTTPPFGHGLHLGSAFVENDRIIVTAAENWGKSRFYQLESKDLEHWSEPRVILEGEGWEGYNTSLCKAGDRYILTFELGAPREFVHTGFTMFFAESTDLVHWKYMEGKSLFKDIYTGSPMLRWYDGVYYFFYLHAIKDVGYVMNVARSTDLVHWEDSPRNPVMTYGEEDRKLLGQFTPSLRKRIAEAVDINVSDMDMCDYDGKLRIVYSWGNQQGTEFLSLAEADMTERQFCESFF